MKVYKGPGTFSRTFGGKPYHLVLSCGGFNEIRDAYSILKKAGLKVAINKHEDHPMEAYDLYVYAPHYEKHKKELYKGMWKDKKLS